MLPDKFVVPVPVIHVWRGAASVGQVLTFGRGILAGYSEVYLPSILVF
jgi:hypothetical protein